MLKKVVAGFALGILTMLSACRPAPILPDALSPSATPTAVVTFATVQALLAERCAVERCHNRESLAGQLDLSAEHSYGNLVDAPSNQQPDSKLVSPSKPADSYLLSKLRAGKTAKGSQMPIGHPALGEEELKLLENWIAAGAPQ